MGFGFLEEVDYGFLVVVALFFGSSGQNWTMVYGRIRQWFLSRICLLAVEDYGLLTTKDYGFLTLEDYGFLAVSICYICERATSNKEWRMGTTNALYISPEGTRVRRDVLQPATIFLFAG